MNIKVVIGANYGDEGKGLVSGCLARESKKNNEKTLTVFYNGTIQRAHTFNGKVHHCMAAGEDYGSDTFYHKDFVVDPIALMITDARPMIDGRCRVILPCDVMLNRRKETERGAARHGSCGFGLYEAVRRSVEPHLAVHAYELLDLQNLLQRVQPIMKYYKAPEDMLYNLRNFLIAAEYVARNCKIITFEEIVGDYDTIIYEGGQGLLLDQANKDCYPHLTPSSTGSRNIFMDIDRLGGKPDLYYVSRSYVTRHGAGPMESECSKEDINPAIVDETNQPNEWQGSLRFGRLDMNSFWKRIKADSDMFTEKNSVNVVFTQLNYTENRIETNAGRQQVALPNFIANVYKSDQKDQMEKE